MNAVKDSVHDYVTLDPVAADLLDTPLLQRLRHVKQLSTVRLVYPSANHTRFEHSLGVYHLADRALDQLGVEGDRADHVRAAALLHDVGHGPYGHQTEGVLARHGEGHHDEVGDLLPGTAAADVLADHGLDVDRVAALIRGEGELGGLVSGELDVDRMDYLVRDAHHTGVPYGTIDHGRLVRALELREGGLVLAEGNVRTAEALLVARTLMTDIVYRHHVSRIAGVMLDRACEALLAEGVVDAGAFRRLADHDLLVALVEHTELGPRIERRDLYKRAVWVGLDGVPAGVPGVDHDDQRSAEREIAERAGVAPHEVVVDVPDRPELTESRTRVVVDGMVRRLEDVSALSSALRAARRDQWRLGVYAPEAHADAVGEAALDVLDVANPA